MTKKLPYALTITAAILALLLHTACKKEGEHPDVGSVIVAAAVGDAVADSSTTITISAQLQHPELIDQREVTFRITSGSFIAPDGEPLATGSYTIWADVAGLAVVRWRAGRMPGHEEWTATPADTSYRTGGGFDSEPAYPDRILLSTETVESDSVVTINALLSKDEGYHSRGLPLTYRAWQNRNGAEVAVGNFLTVPFQPTHAEDTHSIELDLSVPGVTAFPDTVYVQATCGAITAPPIAIYYTP